MSTTQLSELEPLLLLPECPTPRILQALRLSARQFCLNSAIWRESLPEMTTVEDQADYDLTSQSPYSDVRIHDVPRVEIAGVPLVESQWTISANNVITLDPPRHGGRSLVADVVFVPNITCNQVVEWLVSEYGESIAAGAEARLRADPGNINNPVAWYDPNTASYKQRQFEDGVAEAKAAVITDRQSGEVAIELKDFYL